MSRLEQLERQGINPRSLTEPERPWIERWRARGTQAELVARLTDAGHSRLVIWGLVGYLTARHAGDTGASYGYATRARYRKALEQLGPPAAAAA